MKDNYRKVLAVVLAFATCFSFEEMLKINSESYAISNSILSIVIFAASIFFFYHYVLKEKDKRLYIVSIVLGMLFSFFIICGKNILMYDATRLNKVSTWLYILCGTPLWMGIVMCLIKNISRLQEVCRIQKLDDWFEKNFTPKKTSIISWIIIFLAWIPGLIASYPGIYGYDSVFQLGFYIDKKIDLWHPLAHTYFMGFCIEDIGNLLGSREAGMFCYSIIQMVLLSGCFALVVYYMTKKKSPVILRFLMVFVAAFLPVNAIMSFSCTKDVPFSCFMCIMTYIMMRTAEEDAYLSKKSRWVSLLFVFLGVISFRNQGVYVIILGLICGFILLRKQWKRIAVLLLATIMIFVTYTGPVTNALNGVEASKGIEEMLSVPIMQISRAVCYDVGELTEEEVTMAEEYIPTIHEYTSRGDRGISDYFKEDFDSTRFKNNPLEFVKLWVSIGLKSPMSYVDAFARLSIGLWYPDMNYRDPEAYHPYWEYENTPQIQEEWIILERTTPSWLQWLSDYYYDLSYNNSYQQSPIISMLYSGGFYIWVLLLYVAWCVYNKKYNLLFPAMFLVLYWLTTLLGPVVIYRYLYPVFVSLPILLVKMMNLERD